MKSPLGLLLLFVSYVSSSNNIPSLSSAFDYIIQNFSCFYVSSYLFNYTEGTMRMNQNRFLFPLTENMTKIEDSLSLTLNNILITLVSSFRFKPNKMDSVIFFQDVIIQYNINSLILSKKQDNGLIRIKTLELSRPFISKKVDLMTALRFKEFQSDKDDQLYITLELMLEGHIQNMLNEYNINYQFETILSYTLNEAGIVKIPTVIYTVKDLSYKDAKYANKGNYIQVELYTYVTFTKVSNQSIVTAKCNLIVFRDKTFRIGTFTIVEGEIGAQESILKDDFTSIVNEATKKFYEQYD